MQTSPRSHRVVQPLRIFARLAAVLILVLTCSASAFAQRTAWQWPFASDSIWNLPLGTGSTYDWIGFASERTVNADKEYIVYTDAATPVRTVYFPYSGVAGDPYRAHGTTVSWLGSMRVPSWLIVPDITLDPYSTPNDCAAFVHGPTGALTQLQPTTRLQSTGPIWGYPMTGESIYGQGERGAHYGSGLSVLGGSIRAGELTSGAPIRHALKVLCQASKYIYRGTPNGTVPKGFGWRWPADRSDDYAQNPVSSGGYGGTNPNVAMGSLVAIAGWVDVNTLGLSNAKARKIAQAMKDYGAYIVDDTFDATYSIAVSQEALSDFASIPKSDLMKIMTNLWVVTDATQTQKKGPGVPRAALAPGF